MARARMSDARAVVLGRIHEALGAAPAVPEVPRGYRLAGAVPGAGGRCHRRVTSSNRCRKIDWASTKGDLIKRAILDLHPNQRTSTILNLDLPQTGFHTVEEDVPLPYFPSPETQHSQHTVN